MKVYLILFLLIFTACFAGADAQTNAPSETAKKGKKILVSIPITVSDREGRYISGLKKDDFTIFQSGIEQKIDALATFDEPLDIALLLDTSGSTKNSLKEIKEAAKDFVDLLNPSDRCLIATFDTELKSVNQLTADRKTLRKSLDQIVTAEKTGSILFDAIDRTAQNYFSAALPNRKVIVVLSDGKDAGSAVAKNELLAKFEESDVSVYTVFYQTGLGFNKLVIDADGTIREGKQTKPKKVKPPKKKKYSILIPTRADVHTEGDAKLIGKATDIEAVNFLEEISVLTAGRFYQSDAPNLSGIFKRIAGELRQQYRLEYYTKEILTGAKFSEIVIKVNKPDAVVRPRGKFRAKQL